MKYEEFVRKANAVLVRMIDAIDEYVDEMADAVTRHFRPEEEEEVHTDCPWK